MLPAGLGISDLPEQDLQGFIKGTTRSGFLLGDLPQFLTSIGDFQVSGFTMGQEGHSCLPHLKSRVDVAGDVTNYSLHIICQWY